MNAGVQTPAAERTCGIDRSLWMFAAAAVATGAIIIAAHLRYSGLWIDEVYTLHAISLPWRDMVLERLLRGHFPLYFVLLKSWVLLCGHASELSLRLPSFLFWAGAVCLFGGCVRRHLPQREALLAFPLFGLNGLALRQASEARMYTLVLLLAVGFTWAYFSSMQGRRTWPVRLVLIGVPLIAAWTSTTFLLTLLAFAVDAARRRRWDVARDIALAFLLIGLSAAIPVQYHVATRERTEIAHVPPASLVLHAVTFLTGVIGWEDYYAVPLAGRILQTIGGVLALWMVVRLVRRWKQLPDWAQSSAVVTALPLLLMLITWAAEKTFGGRFALHGPARYLIGDLPCAAMLSAALISDRVRGRKEFCAWIVAIAVLLLADAVVVARVHLETSRELIRQHLVPGFRSGDAAVVVPAEAAEAVKLYAPHVTISDVFPRNLSDAEIESRLRKLDRAGRVWLVWVHGKSSPAVRVADRLFGKGTSSSTRRYLGERRVIVYDVATTASMAGNGAKPLPQ